MARAASMVVAGTASMPPEGDILAAAVDRQRIDGLSGMGSAGGKCDGHKSGSNRQVFEMKHMFSSLNWVA